MLILSIVVVIVKLLLLLFYIVIKILYIIQKLKIHKNLVNSRIFNIFADNSNRYITNNKDNNGNNNFRTYK